GPSESIFQPEWDAEGRLHFVSDRDDWWNLYRLDRLDAGMDPEPHQLTAEEADLGHPQWLFGGSTYAFLDDGTIVVLRTARGAERLFALDPGAELLRDLGQPYTSFGFPAIAARGNRVALAAATPEREAEVAVLDPANGETEVVRRASEEEIEPGFVSAPRPIEFPTGDGAAIAHAFYYPPA